MAKIQDIDIPYLEFAEAAAPGTPASGIVRIYAKTDGSLYQKDDAGTETGLAGGGGGSVATDTIFDAKGDLAVGTGADTAAKLTVGNDGQIVIADSSQSTGLRYIDYPVPDIVQSSSHYQASSTTNATTLGATPTKALVCLVFSRTNAPTSITQTNVTWTQRYTGNGNSQYFEVWTGAITGAAGTTVTVNFGSSTTSQIEVYEYNHAEFTSAGSAATTTSSGGTNVQMSKTGLTDGDYVVFGISANGPSSAYGGCNLPFYPATPFGGQGRGATLIFSGGIAAVWSVLSSSVAYFGAIVKIS